MILSSFSKINLGLQIGGIRPDGFHELKTVVIFTSLHDLIEVFEISEHEIVLVCDKDLCKLEDNLAYKACKLIFDRFRVNSGIKIKIKKNIPDGAGLGGGSSNAASVLYAVNKILGLNLSCEDLIRLSANLGSDVPMFFEHGVLKCSGRGEVIHRVCDKVPSCKILIKKGNKKTNTKKAYQSFDALNDKTSDSNASYKLERAIISGDIQIICKNCFNDFEKITEVTEGWHLTGSGSSTFKIVDSSFEVQDKEIFECYSMIPGMRVMN